MKIDLCIQKECWKTRKKDQNLLKNNQLREERVQNKDKKQKSTVVATLVERNVSQERKGKERK
jgi:hypothetical protein